MAQPVGIDLLLAAARAIETSPNARDVSPNQSNHTARNRNDSNSSAGNGRSSGSGTEETRGRRTGGAGTRETHNKLEKNRRAHMKECFEDLKREIPALDDKKTSNLSILRQAYKCIQNMKRQEKQMESNLHQLTTKKIKLTATLNELLKRAEEHFGSILHRAESDMLVDYQGEDEEDGYATDETKSVNSDGANYIPDESSDLEDSHGLDNHHHRMEVDEVEREVVQEQLLPVHRVPAIKPAVQHQVVKVVARQPILAKTEAAKSPPVTHLPTHSNQDVTQKLRKKIEGNAKGPGVQAAKMGKGTQHARIMTPPKPHTNSLHGATIGTVTLPIPLTTAIPRTVQPAMVSASMMSTGMMSTGLMSTGVMSTGTLLSGAKPFQTTSVVLPPPQVMPQMIMGTQVTSGQHSTILFSKSIGPALGSAMSVANSSVYSRDIITRPALAVARSMVSPLPGITATRLPLQYPAQTNNVVSYQQIPLSPLLMVQPNIVPKTTVPTTLNNS